MHYFIKILLALAMIVLPTISQAKIINGGQWHTIPMIKLDSFEFAAAAHLRKRVDGILIFGCEPRSQNIITAWQIHKKYIKNLPKNLRSNNIANVVIDGKKVITLKFMTKSDVDGFTLLYFNDPLQHKLKFVESFRKAQKSIGIQFNNGYEHILNAKGSTKAASVFKQCLKSTKNIKENSLIEGENLKIVSKDRSNARQEAYNNKMLQLKNLSKFELPATKPPTKIKEIGVWKFVDLDKMSTHTRLYAKQLITKSKSIKLSCKRHSGSLYIRLYDTNYQGQDKKTNNIRTKIFIDSKFEITALANSKYIKSHRSGNVELANQNVKLFLDLLHDSKESLLLNLGPDFHFYATSMGNKEISNALRNCLAKQSQ